MRRALAALALALLELAGCSGGKRAYAPPDDLARRAAAAESSLVTLAPSCTTMAGPQANIENCVFTTGDEVRCIRTRLTEPGGATGEMSTWYEAGRPWHLRHVRHQPQPSAREPWRESVLDVYFDAEGHVAWAALGRDDERRPVPAKQYPWLERNLLGAARRELADASARRGLPFAPAPPPLSR